MNIDLNEVSVSCSGNGVNLFPEIFKGEGNVEKMVNHVMINSQLVAMRVKK